MKTTVFKKAGASYDVTDSRFRGFYLRETSEKISKGTAERLLKYAQVRVVNAGLGCFIESTTPQVCTNDAEDSPLDRTYQVSWGNQEGTTLSVVGILTKKGWPFLDHGLDLTEA